MESKQKKTRKIHFIKKNSNKNIGREKGRVVDRKKI